MGLIIEFRDYYGGRAPMSADPCELCGGRLGLIRVLAGAFDAETKELKGFVCLDCLRDGMSSPLAWRAGVVRMPPRPWVEKSQRELAEDAYTIGPGSA